MKPDFNQSRRPLSVWIALLYLPLGVQMLFWMMGFGHVDFSLPNSLMGIPDMLLRYYIGVTVLLYPAFFAYGLFYALHLNRTGAPAWKVVRASFIPFLSAAPYLLVGEMQATFA
ncbi:hypothetical protein Fbal_2632 [Ferrimonas balearica DSM 9799]|uniref:Uncharacterized protein n=1 Tax=Ferrimonas balearica (strain DSM 9799 / CCM 4581 / KCTC 23876 / PAT) TaxID=550540 RepID=E1SQ62_FERBD|nr:hypothetical protein [Ferrimonas balearica]ADN76834.1 hypothetical protein Fbal_2632 [Ferrimonas balearica DSM 9799]MBW3140181.1 hypothetical protein [Ferrimonas balearica]MBW3165201.1 hypothetical protein [Ferrimonas balearica]MBY5979935.1 hypothetical protein [Ferrimonas balearica]MBY6106711.1 hypothetical protein [Ferrimonas balearica]